jgi:cytochrome c-type biogenesis protein CcmH
MIGFAAAATALTALTVALLVVPLARRRKGTPHATQAQASLEVLREDLAELERELAAGAIAKDDYEAAKRSLKVRVLEDAAPETAPADRAGIAPAIVVALALPLAALALYAWLGNPAALDPQRAAAEHQLEAAKIEAMVEKLARRLESSPEDAEGWTMLARSYRVLGRHEEAARAFARAEKRLAADPRLLTDWAESEALAANGRLAGRPAQLLARALAVDPEYPNALALAGAAAFEREDWKGAIAYWERLAKQLPAGSEDAGSVTRSIEAARERLAQAGAR